jgi:glycyl-tRNA synthetase beta chain
VRDFAEYVVKLREAKVILDGAERRAMIAQAAEEMARGEGHVLAADPALLDEIRGLVEWPVPLMGSIDDGFMALPAEALVGTMRANQKYLTMRTAGGALAPRFVVVANMAASDGGAAIIAGNERVLRARLWDARFFWDQDRKTSLESRLPSLHTMVFFKGLGTLGQKAQRVVVLARDVQGYVPGSRLELVERAALLAKADLRTGMVSEFPELQGVMGGHYARAQGELAEVASAIAEQYAPRGQDDRCPRDPTSVIIALADKLDTLVGFFGIDEKPTGSRDPFALRRAALGIIRLVVENNLRIPLRRIIDRSYSLYRAQPYEAFPTPEPPVALDWIKDHKLRFKLIDVSDDLLEFFADRLKVHLRDSGIRHDII